MLDRIDIHIDVPAVKVAKITEGNEMAEDLKTIRKRIVAARRRQEARFKSKKLVANSEMSNRDIRDLCKIEDAAEAVLKQALERLSLSARSYHKVLKVAQTIADIEKSDRILRQHVLEALQYRPKTSE